MVSKVSTEVATVLVIAGLAFSSAMMIAAWVLHLKFDFGFFAALGFSLLFVVPEYISNTYFTRLAKEHDLFNVAQLATISIVFGVVFTAVISVVVFKHPVSARDAAGFVLVCMGVFLLLWDKAIGEPPKGVRAAAVAGRPRKKRAWFYG